MSAFSRIRAALVSLSTISNIWVMSKMCCFYLEVILALHAIVRNNTVPPVDNILQKQSTILKPGCQPDTILLSPLLSPLISPLLLHVSATTVKTQNSLSLQQSFILPFLNYTHLLPFILFSQWSFIPVNH